MTIITTTSVYPLLGTTFQYCHTHPIAGCLTTNSVQVLFVTAVALTLDLS